MSGLSLTTVDELATVTNLGTDASGLLARWNSATNTGYAAVIVN